MFRISGQNSADNTPVFWLSKVLAQHQGFFCFSLCLPTMNRLGMRKRLVGDTAGTNDQENIPYTMLSLKTGDTRRWNWLLRWLLVSNWLSLCLRLKVLSDCFASLVLPSPPFPFTVIIMTHEFSHFCSSYFLTCPAAGK